MITQKKIIKTLHRLGYRTNPTKLAYMLIGAGLEYELIGRNKIYNIDEVVDFIRTLTGADRQNIITIINK